MCEPTIILGAVGAALSIGGTVASYSQAKQDTAFANAQAQQAYQFQTMQVSAARNFEQMRADQQEALIQQNRMLAEKAYGDELSQLNLRLMQEQDAAAQRKQDANKQTMQARGEIQSSGRLGNTIDNLIADVYRQQAAFDFATDRNLAFAGTQTQQEKRGAAGRYASRLGSQQPYIKQPHLDPMKPMMRSNPSALPYLLQGASGAISGFTSGYQTGKGIQDIGKNKPPVPPPPKARPSGFF
jgi:hypothetical protein